MLQRPTRYADLPLEYQGMLIAVRGLYWEAASLVNRWCTIKARRAEGEQQQVQKQALMKAAATLAERKAMMAVTTAEALFAAVEKSPLRAVAVMRALREMPYVRTGIALRHPAPVPSDHIMQRMEDAALMLEAYQ